MHGRPGLITLVCGNALLAIPYDTLARYGILVVLDIL